MSFAEALVIVVIGFLGLNFTFWGCIGLLRLFLNVEVAPIVINYPFTAYHVAVIVLAHNEELVIAHTIESALRIVPVQNIHVVTSDFDRKDTTAEIARSFGVNVLELPPPLSKAHKLQTAVRHFDFAHRFKAVLFVDADTILSEDYLVHALPYFSDPNIVAVAGHATTLWEPHKNSFLNKFFLSYRERFYFFIQLVIKYGQAWKFINVMPIVPGFASIYRSSILPYIHIDKPGLVIEDFNMTFEIHHKQLGRIIYSPKVKAYTQDPDNLRDYFKQIRRWNLGFWQTVFSHGFWPSAFWVSLSFLVFEGMFSAFIFLLFPLTLILIFLGYGLNLPYQFELLIKGVIIGDYLLTLVAAFVENRFSYLVYGFGFLLLRFVDSIAYLYSIPKAIFEQSTGGWISPTRR